MAQSSTLKPSVSATLHPILLNLPYNMFGVPFPRLLLNGDHPQNLPCEKDALVDLYSHQMGLVVAGATLQLLFGKVAGFARPEERAAVITQVMWPRKETKMCRGRPSREEDTFCNLTVVFLQEKSEN